MSFSNSTLKLSANRFDENSSQCDVLRLGSVIEKISLHPRWILLEFDFEINLIETIGFVVPFDARDCRTIPLRSKLLQFWEYSPKSITLAPRSTFAQSSLFWVELFQRKPINHRANHRRSNHVWLIEDICHQNHRLITGRFVWTWRGCWSYVASDSIRPEKKPTQHISKTHRIESVNEWPTSECSYRMTSLAVVSFEFVQSRLYQFEF